MAIKEKERIALTFNKKVREQIIYLFKKTEAASYAEVVRNGLNLFQEKVEKQVEDPNNELEK